MRDFGSALASLTPLEEIIAALMKIAKKRGQSFSVRKFHAIIKKWSQREVEKTADDLSQFVAGRCFPRMERGRFVRFQNGRKIAISFSTLDSAISFLLVQGNLSEAVRKELHQQSLLLAKYVQFQKGMHVRERSISKHEKQVRKRYKQLPSALNSSELAIMAMRLSLTSLCKALHDYLNPLFIGKLDSRQKLITSQYVSKIVCCLPGISISKNQVHARVSKDC